MNYKPILVVLAVIAMAFGACKQQSAYHEMVEHEVASGEVHNDIFMDFELGMTMDSFFLYCWSKNQDSVLTSGSTKGLIQYDFAELGDTMIWEFYPSFHDKKVYNFPINMQYASWSPWAGQFSGDTLQNKMKRYFEKELGGNKFVEVNHPKVKKAWAKVDGNRRITLEKTMDNSGLTATFTDVIVERKLRRDREAASKK